MADKEAAPVRRIADGLLGGHVYWITHPDGFHIEMGTQFRAEQVAREILAGRAALRDAEGSGK